jgi:hypothetical protein
MIETDYDIIFYPWSYIVTKIQWFQTVYGDIMDAEEWQFYGETMQDSDGSLHSIFVVISRKTDPINQYLLNDKAYTIARQYGWEVNKFGVVLNYKAEMQTRNKHVLTVKELGLL